MSSFTIDHKRLYLLVFLLVILVFCLPGPGRAADHTVPGTPYGTLDALRQAGLPASGDTIIMDGNDSSLISEFFFGTKTVTIIGRGTIHQIILDIALQQTPQALSPLGEPRPGWFSAVSTPQALAGLLLTLAL